MFLKFVRYSNYVIVREEKYALKVPNSVPLEVACMLACSGLTTYNAVSALRKEVERTNGFKGN